MVTNCSNNNRIPTSKKVIIFDWDDTICPSSFVDQWKFDSFNDLPLHYQNLLLEVGKSAIKCLTAASHHGTVIIITNSDDGWVKFSAEKFLPNLLPCLDTIRIISARTRYERFYPHQPLCWKAAAFAHEVNEIYATIDSYTTSSSSTTRRPPEYRREEEVVTVTDDSSTDSSFSTVPPKPLQKQLSSSHYKEVISFGDSMEERTAVKIVASQLSASPKSVMFLNNPSPVQLIGQLEMVTDNMAFVCEARKRLDLEISGGEALKSAACYLRRRGLVEFLEGSGMGYYVR
eukprot:CAMPEP_0172500296 /NCGR_PEP_ID=MMETSP1066-20121228/136526_1 /TAXON_ID=671091 /ORGANISM="Coscinodiscus wailesii, Strain CCMP2513" /LENGTH=287 /DNA_ID=CAMNT_0013274449 /DNA_START=164 /DNA_END=1024 /DNA_ORIENTATION=-